MKIEILYIPGCPNLESTVGEVYNALSLDGLAHDVNLIPGESIEMARQLAFVGSPSVRVNGIDIEPDAGRTKEGRWDVESIDKRMGSWLASQPTPCSQKLSKRLSAAKPLKTP